MTAPILTIVTFLPLAGALFIAGTQPGRKGQHPLGRIMDDAAHFCSISSDLVAL